MSSSTLLTVAGRDVLFAHWPVDADVLEPHVPDVLSLETFDGAAWVSVLALENSAVGLGTGPSSALALAPQLNLRTYVTHGGESGVYFLSLDSGRRLTAAVFGARYRPDGPVFEADPGTLEAFCVERFRYFFPPGEDRRIDPLRSSNGAVRAGTIDRDPWRLRPVNVQIRQNTLFEAAGLPAPTSEPAVQYSPGFEMRVGPLETLDGPE
jgi:uncharacterized protein YqjF (DUF2071 family)